MSLRWLGGKRKVLRKLQKIVVFYFILMWAFSPTFPLFQFNFSTLKLEAPQADAAVTAYIKPTTLINNGCTLPSGGNFTDDNPPTTLATNLYQCDSDNSPNVEDQVTFGGFSFGLPGNASIDGIVVHLNDVSLASTVTGTQNFKVRLSWDGGTTWTSAAQNDATVCATPDISSTALDGAEYYCSGTSSTAATADPSSGTTWGHTWAMSEMNSSNFMIQVTADDTSNTAVIQRFDIAEVKVYYTPLPSVSSAANQTFSTGQASTGISTITITDPVPQITATNDIRIAAPAGMTWDTTDTSAVIGGAAAAKVSSTVSYENSGQKLVLNVTSNFAANDTITVSGLSFTNFSKVVTNGALTMYTGGSADTVVDATDDKLITIKGSIVLGNHTLGQVTNKFEAGVTSTTTSFYAFNASTTGEAASTTLTFDLSSITGVASGDITNSKLYVDIDHDQKITASTTFSLAYDPADTLGTHIWMMIEDTIHHVLYAAAAGGEIYRCDMSTVCDQQSDWTISITTTLANAYSIGFDSNNGVIYAGGTSGVIYRCDTSNNCDTSGDWTTYAGTTAKDTFGFAFDPDQSVMYLSANAATLKRCDTTTLCDQATDWTSTLDMSAGFTNQVLYDNIHKVIYAFQDNLVYRCPTSTLCDSAADFTQVFDTGSSNQKAAYSVAFDDINGVIYFGTGTTANIYRCDTNTGCTSSSNWTLAYTPAGVTRAYGLAFDRFNRYFYFGDSASGAIYMCDTATLCDAAGDYSLYQTVSGSTKTDWMQVDSNGYMYAGSDAGIYQRFVGDGVVMSSPTVNISGSTGTLTFSATSTLQQGKYDYFLNSTISNIASGDQITFALSTSKIISYGIVTLNQLGVTGSASNITHTSPQIDLEQSGFRLFDNTDSTGVGNPLAATNATGYLSSLGDDFRIRMLVHASSTATSPLSSINLNLQAAPLGGSLTCSAVSTGNYSNVPKSAATDDWTQITSAAAWTKRRSHPALVYNNLMWISGGLLQTIGTRMNDVWYSSDGATWQQATSNGGWAGRTSHGFLNYNNKMWVMGGNAGSSEKNDVWSSTDGATWTQATATAAWSIRDSFASVVFNGKMWVMGGTNGTNYYNDVWSSTDGITWTQATSSAGWSARQQLAVVVYNNKMWVMGGRTGSTAASALNDVWSSSDGISWNQEVVSAAWSARFTHGVTVYNNKMWLMGGQNSSGTTVNDVWYSTDGTSWAQASGTSGWVGRNNPKPVVYNNKIWVIGGDDSSYYNDVWNIGGPVMFNDNATPTDGATLTTTVNDPTHLGHTINNQSYKESNPASNDKSSVPAGQDAMWDFSLRMNYDVPANTPYCFRLVKTTGSLTTYTNYPQVNYINDTISSAADQTFYVGKATTSISTITITDPGPLITAANDIRISIATSTHGMLWDTTDTSAVIGGSAAGKVSSTVSYEGGGSVLVLNVTSDFVAGDTITVSGLSFANFTSIGPNIAGVLRLHAGGSASYGPNATDDKKIFITGALTIADHIAGQVTNKFSSGVTATTTTFFAFKLNALGETANTTVAVNLSGITGITGSDITAVELYKDNNNDGQVDGSDTQINLAPSVTSWAISNDTTENAIASMVFDSTNGVIYAGSNNGGIIYRCDITTNCDAASDWTISNDTTETGITSLGIDPVNQILYAGSNAGGIIFRCALSTLCDAAGDWTTSYNTPALTIYSLKYVPSLSAMYASADTGVIYRCLTSTGCTSSANWAISTTISSVKVEALEYDSVNQAIYAGVTNDDIYRCPTSNSCDASGDWTKVYDGVQSYLHSFTVDTTNNVIYAGSGQSGAIYRCDLSTGCSSQANWTTLGGFFPDATDNYAMTFDPVNGILYAGSGDNGEVLSCKISTSCDTTAKWSISKGIMDSQPYIDSMTVDTTNGIVYAGSETGAIIYRGTYSSGGSLSTVSISGSNGTISFPTSTTTLSVGATNFLLKATISNIASGDAITFGMATTSVIAYGGTNLMLLNVSGSATNITHTTSASPLSLAMASVGSFIYSYPYSMLVPQLTVTEGGSPSITTSNALRIGIATSSIAMLWDTTKGNISIGGAAASKLSSSVTYEGNGSVLVIPVQSNFTANDVVTLSNAYVTNFTAAGSTTNAFKVLTGGASDIVADATGGIAIIRGTLTVTNATSGQPSNKFDSSVSSITASPLLSFKLMPLAESTTIPSVTVNMENVNGFSSSDVTNAKLYIDYNGNGTVDAGDTQVGGSGVVSISGNTGTITFGSSFTATTTRDYIFVADVNNISSYKEFSLTLNQISSTGVLSFITIPSTGRVYNIHRRVTNFIGGGTDLNPNNPGTNRTGGGNGGGTDINTSTTTTQTNTGGGGGGGGNI